MHAMRWIEPASLLRAMAVAASLTLAGCGSEAPEQAAEETPAPPAAAPQSSAGVRQTGPNQYEARIVAFVGGYRPAEIRIPAGAEVTFRVKSEDLVHGFSIAGTSIQMELPPNEDAVARHTFSEPGEFTFQCHVYCGGGHETMNGRIIVEAPEH
jgi:cytochrome c oxidase subunit 2